MSGIARATAYFNAAAAYNLLGAQASTSTACERDSACYQFALRLLDRSEVSQENQLIDLSGASSTERINEIFKLRRGLERARALRGLAQSHTLERDCGDIDKCLEAASTVMAQYDLETLASRRDEPVAAIACEALDIRWQISQARGHQFEYSTVSDLRRIARFCPPYTAAASDERGEIAFQRGEQLRKSMTVSAGVAPPAADLAHLGIFAISSCARRDALWRIWGWLSTGHRLAEIL